MPRPIRCRRICALPNNSEFYPTSCKKDKKPIILNVDEYEAIRLIDKEGLSQEECSNHMNIARTTAQAIYTSARKKIGTALVDGLPIKIEGGHYRLCDGKYSGCEHKECRRHCKQIKGDN